MNTRSMILAIVGMVLFLAFCIALMISINYNDSLNKEKMQACLSQPNHEWVDSGNAAHDFECRVAE